MTPSEEDSIHADRLRIDICICTFRRPHITQTLHSLARLHTKPEWQIHIIVADNDETESARSMVETTARETGLAVTYIHAPARNISIARNACLGAATAPLLAFIDDDERVTEEWLEHMIAKLENSNADVVLGPVRAIYPQGCPEWIKKNDFHSTKPVFTNGILLTGYSCNVLMRRLSPALNGQRFRLELGRSGGEDTAFFAAVCKAGGIIAYAEDAVVTEEVAPERARLSWLLKRRFRAGQTHGLILKEAEMNLYHRIKHISQASAKFAFCMTGALIHIICFGRMIYWLLRGTLHLGVISKLVGVEELEQYGKKN